MTKPEFTSSTTILLDTTVLIDALRGRNQRRPLLANLVATGHSLATSTISVAEVFSGLRPAEEPGTRALLDALDKFPVSAEIAENAGRLRALLRSQGETRSITDMIIASTALEYGFTLATDNVRDFQMQGLSLYPLP